MVALVAIHVIEVRLHHNAENGAVHPKMPKIGGLVPERVESLLQKEQPLDFSVFVIHGQIGPRGPRRTDAH